MKYQFYAVIQSENEAYNVTFPDLPGAITCGKNFEDAVSMAKDALEGHLLVMEDDNDNTPESSDYHELTDGLNDNETLQSITVDTTLVRARKA